MNLNTKIESFEILKKYSKKLAEIPYETIYNLLIEIGLPICIAKLYKGTPIDRARKNNDSKLFNNINDLGYIKDISVIEKIDYGRANLPHQAMFYGAIPSEIDKTRGTAIAETSDLFRNLEIDCLEGDIYTVSRWKVKESFEVCEIVFSDEAIKKNKQVYESYQKQLTFLKQEGLAKAEIDFHLELLRFISSEFSKNVKNSCDYKISVAFANLLFNKCPQIKGIIFPSVQTHFLGQNIVMTPNNVDNYLKPTLCTMHKLYKKGKDFTIANEGYYCELNDNDSILNWIYDEIKTGATPK